MDKQEKLEIVRGHLQSVKRITSGLTPDDLVMALLDRFGEDLTREGLHETPSRYVKAMRDTWMSGYRQKPEDVLKVFEDGAEGCDQLVTVRSIPFFSLCEHHVSPFMGVVSVAYIPSERIVGLSKFPRLIDIFARRLQVQERLTNQIANAINEHLKPKGVGVVIEARHTCMESRGVQKHGAVTVTSALRGALLNEPEARAEFNSLIRSKPWAG